jgi:poly(3-hydroxybutyrate) depolymerase
VPTIVFHGDQDRIVHPRNGEAVISASLAGAAASSASAGDRTRGAASVESDSSPKGRRFTRSVYVDEQGLAWAEHWLVHGAGHAWSGGDARGSHTDASGPDATREMVRFFLQHAQGSRPRATAG